MGTLPDSAGTREWAEAYAARRWPIIPLVGKVPAVRKWQLFEATPVNVRFWFGSRRCNVGLRTGESGYVVVDTDTAHAEDWVRRQLPETPMRARSGGGQGWGGLSGRMPSGGRNS